MKNNLQLIDANQLRVLTAEVIRGQAAMERAVEKHNGLAETMKNGEALRAQALKNNDINEFDKQSKAMVNAHRKIGDVVAALNAAETEYAKLRERLAKLVAVEDAGKAEDAA